MKEYTGRRNEESGELVVEVVEDGRARPLHHVVHHSPDGLEVGYGVSGPADLALSILADALEERPTSAELFAGRAVCFSHHQEFKVQVLAHLQAPFSISEEQVRAFLGERGVDPERPAWIRIVLPTQPAAKTALAMSLCTTAEGLLDAADDSPSEGAASALREAAFELHAALHNADMGRPDDDGTEQAPDL